MSTRAPGYFIELAQKYIADVLDGTIPACKWVKLACQRQLKDLERTDWQYRFDVDRAERVCRFIELLPHVKGPMANARKRLLLEPWQAFILTTVFGWVDAEGNRRFRVAYCEVPRKNGKSTFSSGIGLYMLCADRERGADVFSAATHRDQARIVWDDAAAMVARSPELQQQLGVEANKRAIFQAKTGSKFVPVAREARGNLDGLNIHAAIVDELHAHKSSALWDVLLTGVGARSQPLIWAITTAGFDRSGICYDRRTFCTRVLEGTYESDQTFGIIYTIDEGDDWTSPTSWAKANPNWGRSINMSVLESAAKDAIQQPTAQNNFLTKHLNVWVNASSAWMDMLAWDKCADEQLSEQDFRDSSDPCFIATDLATRKDIAAICRLYIRDLQEQSESGKMVSRRHYYAFFRYYLPEATAAQGKSDRYTLWDAQGRFQLCPGAAIDLDMIEDDLRADARVVKLEKVVFDPWNAAQICQHLSKDQLPIQEMRPTTGNISEAMKELEAAVLTGRFHFNGDPILSWMASNVVLKLDTKGNYYPDKDSPDMKIDGIFALVMAMASSAQTVPEPPSFQAFVL